MTNVSHDRQEITARERAARKDLAQEIAELADGDIYERGDAYDVILQKGLTSGRFRIISSTHLTVEMSSADPDLVCDLAARLGLNRSRR